MGSGAWVLGGEGWALSSWKALGGVQGPASALAGLLGVPREGGRAERALPRERERAQRERERERAHTERAEGSYRDRVWALTGQGLLQEKIGGLFRGVYRKIL